MVDMAMEGRWEGKGVAVFYLVSPPALLSCSVPPLDCLQSCAVLIGTTCSSSGCTCRARSPAPRLPLSLLPTASRPLAALPCPGAHAGHAATTCHQPGYFFLIVPSRSHLAPPRSSRWTCCTCSSTAPSSPSCSPPTASRCTWCAQLPCTPVQWSVSHALPCTRSALRAPSMQHPGAPGALCARCPCFLWACVLLCHAMAWVLWHTAQGRGVHAAGCPLCTRRRCPCFNPCSTPRLKPPARAAPAAPPLAGPGPVLDVPQLQPARARLPAVPPHHRCAALRLLRRFAAQLQPACPCAAGPPASHPSPCCVRNSLPICFRFLLLPLPLQPTWTRASRMPARRTCSGRTTCASSAARSSRPRVRRCSTAHARCTRRASQLPASAAA